MGREVTLKSRILLWISAHLDLGLAKLQVSKNVPHCTKLSSSLWNVSSPQYEIGDMLRQSWFILWLSCPCLLVFLLPELAMSPLYSNQVASCTPACRLGGREEEDEAVGGEWCHPPASHWRLPPACVHVCAPARGSLVTSQRSDDRGSSLC